MCADPNSAIIALDRDARALYDLLIEPISEYLDPGRTLIIEPDEPLYSIPFQSLRDPQGQYLVEKFALVWSPGLYFTEVGQSDLPLDAARRVLVVGAPAIAMGNVNALVPLPDAFAEAETIAEKFRNVHLVRGAQASLSLIKRELPKSEIFHFAGHAISSADRVGLIVAGNESNRPTQGFLDAVQIEQLPMVNTQLAVFSACSTEKTLDGSFDDPQSLVHAFLRAGVRRVVASRWNVDSASTATLMNEFYDRLLASASSSQALRLATLRVRYSREHSHPYYWAAFSLFGQS
jgi:CHAT domain-containing protein